MINHPSNGLPKARIKQDRVYILGCEFGDADPIM